MGIRNLWPDEEAPSAYAIDYEGYYAQGKRAVLFDIDNTLVPHGAPATPEAQALFERLRGIGLATCLVSNNQTPRVKPFADAVDSPFLPNAHKPAASGYRKALQLLGVSPEQALLVGDQLFTDVWGAKRAGIRTILVPRIHPKEEIQIVLKRLLERPVLALYHRSLKKRGQ